MMQCGKVAAHRVGIHDENLPHRFQPSLGLKLMFTVVHVRLHIQIISELTKEDQKFNRQHTPYFL
jgi:hypothetical protein